ncbi:hypothetical protein [Dokdonella sp.]|uniref:hypothetical protein n=1 Tax=Dokdonella sp. TaxID=2291710 RepID=UPI003BB182AF
MATDFAPRSGRIADPRSLLHGPLRVPDHMTIRTRSHHLVVMIACGSLRGAPAIAEDIVRVQRPDVVLPWFNGVIGKVGTDIAWLSDPPITEIRVQGHAGSTLLPPNRRRRLGHGCRALSGTACAVAGGPFHKPAATRSATASIRISAWSVTRRLPCWSTTMSSFARHSKTTN